MEKSIKKVIKENDCLKLYYIDDIKVFISRDRSDIDKELIDEN
ncbi:MAG: hypothetical protein WC867_02110 [Candidatus Pacearchaeota archaeon]